MSPGRPERGRKPCHPELPFTSHKRGIDETWRSEFQTAAKDLAARLRTCPVFGSHCTPVILSAAKDLAAHRARPLCCAQGDNQGQRPGCSRENWPYKRFSQIYKIAKCLMFRTHFEMYSCSLMIDIQFQSTREICPGLLELLKTEMTKSHHIETVHFVSPVQIILEYQKVRQRNGEIVDFYVVEQVLLPVIDQLIEAASGFPGVPQLEPGQPLIEDHIRWLVIVKHCAGRFFEPLRCSPEIFCSLSGQAQSLVRASQKVMNIVFLSACQFAFAEIFREDQRLT